MTDVELINDNAINAKYGNRMQAMTEEELTRL